MDIQKLLLITQGDLFKSKISFWKYFLHNMLLQMTSKYLCKNKMLIPLEKISVYL